MSDDLWVRGLEQSTTGLILIGLQELDFGRVLGINPAAAEALGHEAATLLGSELPSRIARLGLSEGDGAEIVSSLRRLAIGDADSFRTRLRIVDAAGESRWIEATVSSVCTASGNPEAALVRPDDITGDELLAMAREASRAVAQALAPVLTVEAALAALPAALAGAFGAAFAADWTLERTNGLLRARSTWANPTDAVRTFAQVTRERSLTPARDLVGSVWRSGRHSVDREPAEDGLGVRASAAATAGLRSGLALPVRVQNQVIAVIELLFDTTLPRAATFDQAAEDLAADIGRLIEPLWVSERRQSAQELLLVEDNEFVARLVREMLHSSYDDPELRLVHVETLAAACEQLATTRPQCVVLDLTLPDAGGLDALLEIRERAPEVPIVVLTGEEDEAVAERAVREGAQDYLMKRRVDLHGLARSIRYAIGRKNLEQRVLAHRLRHPLTGLPTRVLFLDQVRVALSRSQPAGVAVMIINADRFRRVNNSLGHEVGDRLLLELTARIQQTAGERVSVAGLGGDAFALLIEAPRAELAAVGLARRLRESVNLPFALGEDEVVITATIGVAVGDLDTPSAESLVGDAETALGLGKERGGDGFEVFAESAREEMRERLRLEGGLRAAIDRDELRLHYQPIVSLADGQIEVLEALVRWEHPERGLLAPGVFMPIAEQSGLDIPLGRWVLREACRQLRLWRDCHPGVRVSVNLSAAQIQDPGLIDDVRAILAEEGVPAEALTLEVTETSLMQDLALSAGVLAELRELGFRLALDDFGTGYSSLSYISQLPIDAIKLDRSFVRHLGRERESAIVALVGSLSRALDLPAIAEGVEDGADIQRLRALGYGLGQGYWFSRPVPPDEAVALLEVPTAAAV